VSALPPREGFVKYVCDHVTRAIESWDETTAEEVYVIWLVLSLMEDDSRYVEVSAVGYGTRSHTTPELIESYGSEWSPGCWAGGTLLNLCHPSHEKFVDLYGGDDDREGRALRDAYLKEAVTRFDRSDEEKGTVFEHSKLQYRHNESPREFPKDQLDQLEAISRRFKVTDVERRILEDRHDHLLTLYGQALMDPILDACGEVVRRVHASGILERKCGRAVPVGITFSNDVDAQVAVAVTTAANPPGLSRGLEEWMLGRTYEQIEAEQAFLDAVRAKEPEDQAAFWVEAILADAESRYLDKPCELAEELRSLGLWSMKIGPLVRQTPEVVGPFVSFLVPMIEERISPGLGDPKNEIAMALLGAVESVGRSGRARDLVLDQDVDRLHGLLARLFRDSEPMERVGMATTLVARTLHALRPEQFPRDKFGSGGETANRLLNYRAFGLAKSDPSTPDYDEAAEEARRARRRRSLGL
jgi:hypothetical protein